MFNERTLIVIVVHLLIAIFYLVIRKWLNNRMRIIGLLGGYLLLLQIGLLFGAYCFSGFSYDLQSSWVYLTGGAILLTIDIHHHRSTGSAFH
ncbi:hypothetical protein K8R42_03515 [bacterium]|nr:hypothetical protein [bacterium]